MTLEKISDSEYRVVMENKEIQKSNLSFRQSQCLFNNSKLLKRRIFRLVSKDESQFGSKILIYGEEIEDLKRYLQKKYLND